MRSPDPVARGTRTQARIRGVGEPARPSCTQPPTSIVQWGRRLAPPGLAGRVKRGSRLSRESSGGG
eukprot:8469982-Alexandrium_andersonii.AAC.1